MAKEIEGWKWLLENDEDYSIALKQVKDTWTKNVIGDRPENLEDASEPPTEYPCVALFNISRTLDAYVVDCGYVYPNDFKA